MKRCLAPIFLILILGLSAASCSSTSDATESSTTVLGIATDVTPTVEAAPETSDTATESSEAPSSTVGAPETDSGTVPTTELAPPEYTEEELMQGVMSVFASTTPVLATEATPVIMDHPATVSVNVFEYNPDANALVLDVSTNYDAATEEESVVEYAWSLTQGVSGFYVALIEDDPAAAAPFIPYFPAFQLTVDGVSYSVDSDTMISVGMYDIDRSEWETRIVGYQLSSALPQPS